VEILLWFRDFALRNGLRYWVDSARVRELGWKPEHTFEEALEETIAWYRANPWWWRPLKERGASRRLGLADRAQTRGEQR
jgi:dTDP-D-glucose 4,6-dehydratase